LVSTSVFVLLIFLLTPGFAPLANWIGQAVGAAIFYSILISSRLDNLDDCSEFSNFVITLIHHRTIPVFVDIHLSFHAAIR
jgi:hypothetical protein